MKIGIRENWNFVKMLGETLSTLPLNQIKYLALPVFQMKFLTGESLFLLSTLSWVGIRNMQFLALDKEKAETVF